MLAHARGEVLFVTGAGTSMPSGLPDFRQLVVQAYQQLDAAIHTVVRVEPKLRPPSKGLTHKQAAEIERFDKGDFDVVLGMLERRIDGLTSSRGKVRQKVGDLIRTIRDPSGRSVPPRPAPIHRALIRLADRGAATTIATTNFDRLLQAASPRSVVTHTLGGIPRPSLREDFAGVMHIHGVLSSDPRQPFEMVATDRDFGEFYLRRRIVPDFIYDAARLFNLVLVGYSANDAPMRYLLNAVAADGSRFRDLRERFAFVPGVSPADPVPLEDWIGRGITPIPYDNSANHQQLSSTLVRWSELSAVNGNQRRVDALLKRLVKSSRASTPESERDLFDHLVRRSPQNERLRRSAMISRTGANVDWLDAMNEIALEADSEMAS